MDGYGVSTTGSNGDRSCDDIISCIATAFLDSNRAKKLPALEATRFWEADALMAFFQDPVCACWRLGIPFNVMLCAAHILGRLQETYCRHWRPVDEMGLQICASRIMPGGAMVTATGLVHTSVMPNQEHILLYTYDTESVLFFGCAPPESSDRRGNSPFTAMISAMCCSRLSQKELLQRLWHVFTQARRIEAFDLRVNVAGSQRKHGQLTVAA